MKILGNLIKILGKYKYILAFVALLVLIAFVNIPVIKEGLTGMSQYAYLAPLPKNYMEVKGIDDAYLINFYTKYYQNQRATQTPPPNGWASLDSVVQPSINAYKANPDFYKEEMDFYLANGYFPWDSYIQQQMEEFANKNPDPKLSKSEMLKIMKSNYSNRIAFNLLLLRGTDPNLKDTDAYKIYMGTMTDPSETNMPTSLPSLTSSSLTTTTSLTNVTLDDFLSLCKRATI